MDGIEANLAALVESASLVVWDFDGVIADTEPLQAAAFAHILGTTGNYFDATNDFPPFVGRSELEIWTDLVARLGIEVPISGLVRARSEFYLASALKLKPNLFVDALLDAARSFGKQNVIVSSGNYFHIDPLLTKWELRHNFSSVLCASSPDHEDLTTKAQRLDVLELEAAGPWLVVEDSATYIDRAKAHGHFAVGVSHSMNSLEHCNADLILAAA